MRLPHALEPGLPYPLGATCVPEGINFAVFSDHAQQIDVCLFDATGAYQFKRLPLTIYTDGVWHGLLPGGTAGLVYGLRAHGPYHPEHGHRFNAHKLLLDPYAREVVGSHVWHDAHYAYERGHPEGHRSFDHRDNAHLALKARVISPLEPVRPLERPISPADTVLYELHVKGFSRLNERIPAELRGTYRGLSHPASIAHFKRLGITTLSIQPAHMSLSEPHLPRQGLGNYWGYNTLGFFLADPRYSTSPHNPAAARDEFREMTAALHAEGLEVVLDVVYNHTVEGNELGPTLSFRGLDNASYYRLLPEDRAHYENLSGCGNTVNVAHPRVTQLVLDSLRYWVQDMGVDGFRFDIAPILGRTAHGFDSQSAFFTSLRQDPVLARVKLIAEPWDLGRDGYQLGRFPGRFMEWNDRFRDTTRRYWLSRSVRRGEFARRITGSSDVFHHGHRAPSASVNFVTAHDGFTLHDLVSYSQKHNEANGENNRDGSNANYSVNCGVEGPSDDPHVQAMRQRLKRALLATCVLSLGTPMLLAGDELGRTQRGNNNAYCQDNDISWIDWASTDDTLTDYVAHLIKLRAMLHAIRDNRWFYGRVNKEGVKDVTWLAPAGHELTVNDWHDEFRYAFAGMLVGEHDSGQRALAIFNPELESVTFKLPPGEWRCLLDSARDSQHELGMCSSDYVAPAQAFVVLAQASAMKDQA